MSPHTLIGSRFHHYVARCVKQGHRLVESGRLGATVTELRRGREIGAEQWCQEPKMDAGGRVNE